MKNTKWIPVRAVALAALLLAGVAGAVIGQTVVFATDGNLSASDPMNSTGSYEDRFTVRVSEGTMIQVVVESDMLDTYLTASLPGGAFVENDDFAGTNAGFARMIEQTGQMEVRASSLYEGEEGMYTLTVTELPAPQEVAGGDVITGRFGKGAGPATAHYMLYGSAGDRYIINLNSDDFDAYLTVVDHNGYSDYNDDGPMGYNSQLVYQFDSDGWLMITATSISGDELGSYELLIGSGGGTVIAEYEDSIGDGDPRAYDGSRYDTYELPVVEGETYQLFLSSIDFDARLFVSRANGENLASDDDGGGGTDSLISFTAPESGTYTVYVLSYFDEPGGYTLTVSQ